MMRLLGLVALAAFALAGSGALASPDSQLARFEGLFRQGHVVLGRTDPGATVRLQDLSLPVTPDGTFVIAFDRDADREATLFIDTPGGAAETLPLTIAPREYVVQRIDGLPPAMVTPPEEVLARIRAEGEQKAAARAMVTGRTDFATDWIWPVTGRITGTYGNQRVLNGEPRRPHYGIDIAAPAGTPVKAPAGGIVTLAEDDMYFEGGLVFVDHGHGLIGVFMHLGEIAVEVGQEIAQGDTIAAVGSTGRSTGAHLDWRMYWRNTRVDPGSLVPPMPAP